MASEQPSSRISERLAPDPAEVQRNVTAALAEDLGDGDRTAQLIPQERALRTRVVCREAAVFCGRAWFDETFRQLSSEVRIDWEV
ncbi:MAG: nicotinate-nucleotide diphosphorylase, partial [Xanthomonadales bacterium]|nr:nicotinate-nucleotide diphosphorylase [Xanthomonadales bacterium]